MCAAPRQRKVALPSAVCPCVADCGEAVPLATLSFTDHACKHELYLRSNRSTLGDMYRGHTGPVSLLPERNGRMLPVNEAPLT